MQHRPPVAQAIEVFDGHTRLRCIVTHPAGNLVIDPLHRLENTYVLRYLTAQVNMALSMAWTMEQRAVPVELVAKTVKALVDPQAIKTIYDALGYATEGMLALNGVPANCLYEGWLVEYNPHLHGELTEH